MAELYSVYKRRRWAIVAVSTLCGSLGPLAANIYFPLMEILSRDFGTTKATINLTVSVFMAVIAVCPLILSQVSDRCGRRPVLLVSVSIYAISNVLLAVLPASVATFFTLRVFQGLGASNLAVGVGIISDISEPKCRGRFISFYMLGPQLGPVIGPLLGMVGAETSWRNNFVILACLSCLSVVLVFLFMPETLRSLVGDGAGTFKGIFAWPLFRRPKQVSVDTNATRRNLTLYFRLCANKPVILSSISGALSFSCFYAVLVEYSSVLRTAFGFTTIQICLSYLCPGVSLVAGSILFGRVTDHLRAAGETGPEKRILLQIACLPAALSGVVMFAWSAHFRVHCVMVIVASFLVSFSVSGILITNTTYLSELSRGKSASFVAFGNLLRNAAAAAFVAVIEPLRSRVGLGWAFTSLASTLLVSTILSVWLYVKGPRWRALREGPNMGNPKLERTEIEENDAETDHETKETL